MAWVVMRASSNKRGVYGYEGQRVDCDVRSDGDIAHHPGERGIPVPPVPFDDCDVGRERADFHKDEERGADAQGCSHQRVHLRRLAGSEPEDGGQEVGKTDDEQGYVDGQHRLDTFSQDASSGIDGVYPEDSMAY